jgi:hypothetical protein
MAESTLRRSIGSWGIGGAIATALTMAAYYSQLAGHGSWAVPLLVLAAAGFGYGAYRAAAARDGENHSLRADRIEGIVWGAAALSLLLWSHWAPREVLGKPGEVNEVWISPTPAGESGGKSISIDPAFIRAIEAIVLFGLVGGLLSTTVRLGRRALTSLRLCVGGALAWAFAMIAMTYPMMLAIYLLPEIMSRLLHPVSEMAGIILGSALAGLVVSSLAGAIGESLTSGLRLRAPFPAS